ncbi:MAG: hypothetical protein GY804_01030 [Alphaproteobacteria bacterium]|nr:hypothetical protein [Alphaproteobacteria bacterium]
MNLSQFVATFERELTWTCAKCNSVGTIVYTKSFNADQVIEQINIDHHNLTFNPELKKSTCLEPIYEITIKG